MAGILRKKTPKLRSRRNLKLFCRGSYRYQGMPFTLNANLNPDMPLGAKLSLVIFAGAGHFRISHFVFIFLAYGRLEERCINDCAFF